MPELQKVADPERIVTDSVLLSALVKQKIDKDYVELYQDYAPRSLGKGHSPYAKFYRDLKSSKRFMVISGLPMVKPDGTKIEVGWSYSKGNYTSRANLFLAVVKGTQVNLTVLNDQPDGRKLNDSLTYHPQLFLDGVEQKCGKATLLATDPVNGNYSGNVLEWNYGICKRRLRIIEGRLLGSWVFVQKPSGEVKIKYNQTGDFRLRLGQFKVSNDEEVIKPEDFDELARVEDYPVIISDSSTFYPDADPETSSVDGQAYWYVIEGDTWAAMRDGAGTGADSSLNALAYISSDDETNKWRCLERQIILFDTSGLPDNANISGATLSLYGYNKTDVEGWAPDVNVYSSNPASNTDVIAADYTCLGSTPFSTAITYANWKIADPFWNDFVLNASGIAAISKTGASKFGCRCPMYDVADTPPTWASVKWCQLYAYSSEQGAGFKPKLVVTYTDFIPQAVAGVLTSAGAMIKMTGKNAGQGYVSFSGVLVAVHSYLKSIAGTLTSAGALIKTPTKMLSGALTSTGAFEKLVKKMPAGTITSTGVLIKDTFKELVGTLTSTGALIAIRFIEIAVSGVLSIAGAVTGIIVVFSQACAGTLTSAGSLTRNIYLNVAGTLTSAGAAIKKTSIDVAGSLWYIAGAIVKNVDKELSGTLTSVGSLTSFHMFAVAVAGALTSAGALVKMTSKALAGTMTSSGAITRWVRMSLSGTVTFSGSVLKFIKKAVAGVLGMTGYVPMPGRTLVAKVFTQPYLDASVETRPYLDASVETREARE